MKSFDYFQKMYERMLGQYLLLLMVCMLVELPLSAQPPVQKRRFTLSEAILQAQKASPEAQAARHTYRSAYWNYRSFRANYLPEVSLTSDPYLNRQINRVTQPDGTEQFRAQNTLNTDLSLTISQNVWFTGGNLFFQSSVNRMDELGGRTTSYNTQPFSIGYNQSFFGYNSLKWNRRIEPVRYREARKSYAETLELIASQTCSYFYALASAQTNLSIALSNQASADTLWRYAQGRYRIGSITENEMLQLEVNKLNEEASVMQARMNVEDAMQTLRSFLGLADGQDIEVLPIDSILSFEVPIDEALRRAYENSPEPENFKRIPIATR